MKVKILQCDTRPIKFFLESYDLKYGTPNHMNIENIINLNNGNLLHEADILSLTLIINILKSKFAGFEYEFYKGNASDWAFPSDPENIGKMFIAWIKIPYIIKQIKDPKNSDIDIFCYIDSDAWIRDEVAMFSFCKEFMNSNYTCAMPRDLEMENSCFFNAGFIAFKNNKESLNIFESIYKDSEYRKYDNYNLCEQRCLSLYYEKDPSKFMVLPLNDFNTPCGRIVRHCWIKHILQPFVLEELYATIMKITLSFVKSDPKYSIGNDYLVYS